MELKCLKSYSSAQVSLDKGDTTEGRELSEDKKLQMLTDFPERFELIESEEKEEEKEEKEEKEETKNLDIDIKVPLVETKEEDSQLKKAAREKKAK